MRLWKTAACALCVALAVSGLVFLDAASAGSSAQRDLIELRDEYFEWEDVIEEGATFKWGADVYNNTDSDVRLEVILDLRDDDDRTVNRDEQGNPTDAVIITIGPRTPAGPSTIVVNQEGVIAYDQAAEVVSYIHRYRILQ